MDAFTAIQQRRSCRNFLAEPLDEEIVHKILEAAIWAPSPLNTQPWKFFVITNQEIKRKIHAEAESCRNFLAGKEGWGFMAKYDLGFLLKVPVIIAVIGDPQKTGADALLEERGTAYQLACAAAVQNMLLTAHELGVASLWLTLFKKDALREILSIDSSQYPLSLVCLGKGAEEPSLTRRKAFEDKTTYLR